MRLFNSEGLGKIYSLPVSTAPAVAEAGAPPQADAAPDEAKETKGDKSLPDPTSAARLLAVLLAGAGVAAAIVFNVLKVNREEFNPSEVSAANFALFAGFYVGALIIERAGELVAPSMPPWKAPKRGPRPIDPRTGEPTGEGPVLDDDARSAHLKADRAMVMLGINFLAGVVLATALGLYFMKAIGMHVSTTVDTVFTGLVIAGGTKKLHDFMSLVQNKDNPTTGTGAK